MMTSKGDAWVCTSARCLLHERRLIMLQDPPEQVIKDCTAEVSEVLRVLRPQNSTFLYLTFGQPHFRKRYLIRSGMSLKVHELGAMFHYYLYVLTRKPA